MEGNILMVKMIWFLLELHCKCYLRIDKVQCKNVRKIISLKCSLDDSLLKCLQLLIDWKSWLPGAGATCLRYFKLSWTPIVSWAIVITGCQRRRLHIFLQTTSPILINQFQNICTELFIRWTSFKIIQRILWNVELMSRRHQKDGKMPKL